MKSYTTYCIISHVFQIYFVFGHCRFNPTINFISITTDQVNVAFFILILKYNTHMRNNFRGVTQAFRDTHAWYKKYILFLPVTIKIRK